jgi:superfamily II DNA or RNA helicase
LFQNLESFAELEARISALPTPNERGDAFEVFAEAYFATQKRHDLVACNLWPVSLAPQDVLARLNQKVDGSDDGIDGIYGLKTGGYAVYQVKFRSGRPSLTWEELSTFFGLADGPEIKEKVVFTNCDGIVDTARERVGSYIISGTDLSRIGEADFKEIAGWLSGGIVCVRKKDPCPHQQEALGALLPALERNDLVTAVMACATGKTLVALWAMERWLRKLSRPGRVLVLLPSLALLRQILHEWLKETRLEDLSYLCVCSDPTVSSGTDEIVVRQSEIDFKVSTDPEEVRRFLAHESEGPKIVFSTYQSVEVVQRGAADTVWDFGVFDEAHKTVGYEGRKFAFALDDANIRISKRLFLTATPRHYNPLKKDEDGEAELVFSMDNQAIYGPQAYVLSFAEAARRGIICRYKVLVTAITSDQVEQERLNNRLLGRSYTIVGGDEVRSQQVANQLALRAAVDAHNVKKIFTFHARVKSAASFVSPNGEGVRSHLPGYVYDHVSGDMRTNMRDKRIDTFRKAERAVMSNARCLTEGVDVPAVDMVCFFSRKKSRVDIVQAIGRAMRKAEGKEVGYVLLPLYVERPEGETEEAAVERANFKEVWEVLQALQEQDEVLADVIREMAVAEGEGKGFDDSRIREHVEIVASGMRFVELGALRRAVEVRCIERLGSSWDLMFGRLKAFKEREGHCRVPDHSGELGDWVGRQRGYRKTGHLSSDRVERLDAIGFVWDPHAEYFERMFQKLREFKEREGHCRIPRTSGELWRWAANLRTTRRAGKLSQDKVARLDDLGFSWEPEEEDFERMSQKLREFKEREGHCRVPRGYVDKQLATFVNGLRGRRRDGYLSREQIEGLDALGFSWDPYADDFEEMFRQLCEFKKREGHCRVPQDLGALGGFVSSVRMRRSRGKLSEDKIKRLDVLGFSWDPYGEFFEENLQKLRMFKEREGHCRVPNGYADQDLAGWVARLRQRKKLGGLSQDEITRLDALGFCWDMKAVRLEELGARFERMLGRLHEFANREGSCRVLEKHGDKELMTFISKLRLLRKRGKLTPELIAQLDTIGFSWGPVSEDFEERFERLRRFSDREGHSRIPKGYAERELATFVGTLRSRRKRGTLSEEQIERLDALGFSWDPYADDFKEMFGKLLLFKEREGHCRVPKDNPELGNFVDSLRQRRKQGRLSREYVERLDALGFSWDPYAEAFEVQFRRLCEFREREGHCLVPQTYREWGLGAWVLKLRQRRKDGTLPDDLVARLNGIGFCWEPHSFLWEKMFAELVEYREKHGNCDVPVSGKYEALGVWVHHQRRKFRKGTLIKDHVDRLNGLGFRWDTKNHQNVAGVISGVSSPVESSEG